MLLLPLSVMMYGIIILLILEIFLLTLIMMVLAPIFIFIQMVRAFSVYFKYYFVIKIYYRSDDGYSLAHCPGRGRGSALLSPSRFDDFSSARPGTALELRRLERGSNAQI
jgi:hypothetical protein